ncbi:unnamed protein product [Psylliodes chrysocephalus]|uniref:Uncharacterized protein n=1 Tax=Psylliodes chrysocephalus TaxID=3402493 RepID=A0A9P0DC48_9CUCU|nr:unnamed protein product [Psylliodes chrysocephala]
MAVVYDKVAIINTDSDNVSPLPINTNNPKRDTMLAGSAEISPDGIEVCQKTDHKVWQIVIQNNIDLEEDQVPNNVKIGDDSNNISDIEYEVGEIVIKHVELEENQVPISKSRKAVEVAVCEKKGDTEEEENRNSYTKKGDLRKRKKLNDSKSVKKQKICEKLCSNHNVLPPCTGTCKKQCFTKIKEEQRA